MYLDQCIDIIPKAQIFNYAADNLYSIFTPYYPTFMNSFIPDSAIVARIAELAKLSFTEEEKEVFTREFGQILGAIEEINTLDLSGVEPLTHVLDLPDILRADESTPSLSVRDALKNAPQKNETFFKVPKVLE